MARFADLIQLSPSYDTLSSWWIIGLLIFLSLIKFLVDKFPAVNHMNDFAIQTFVRPAAGATVFTTSTDVITQVHPVLALALGLLVAGSVHTVKTTTVRPASNSGNCKCRQHPGKRRGGTVSIFRLLSLLQRSSSRCFLSGFSGTFSCVPQEDQQLNETKNISRFVILKKRLKRS